MRWPRRHISAEWHLLSVADQVRKNMHPGVWRIPAGDRQIRPAVVSRPKLFSF
jgi:hypothetical protein